MAAASLSGVMGAGWETAALGKTGIGQAGKLKDAAAEYAEAEPKVKEWVAGGKGKPAILLFLSSAQQKKAGADANSAPADASETVRQFLVTGNGEDYKCIAAARFFTRIQIDVTNVIGAEDRVFCNANAPLVVLLDKDGKVANAFQGKAECTVAKIYPAMLSLLLGGQVPAKSVEALAKKMKEVFEVQLQIEQGKGRKGDAKALDAKKEKLAKEMEKLAQPAEKQDKA